MSDLITITAKVIEVGDIEVPNLETPAISGVLLRRTAPNGDKHLIRMELSTGAARKLAKHLYDDVEISIRLPSKE